MSRFLFRLKIGAIILFALPPIFVISFLALFVVHTGTAANTAWDDLVDILTSTVWLSGDRNIWVAFKKGERIDL